MGGRVAEKLKFNQYTTGAGNDLDRATALARKMVCDWGMSDKVGPLAFGRREEEIFLGRDLARKRDYSEATAIDIDNEIRRIVLIAEKSATELLSGNFDKLERVAEVLLEKEILEGSEIDEILRKFDLEKEEKPVEAPGQNEKADK
jgi:cell division protease FtsH